MSEEKTELLFHCSVPKYNKDGDFIIKKNGRVAKELSTHTLMFYKHSNNSIIVGWAVKAKNDSYSKKVGRHISTNRAKEVANRLINFPTRKTVKVDRITTNHVPKIIISNFNHYFNKAIKSFYEINNITDINLYFKTEIHDAPVCKLEISSKEIITSINIEYNDKLLDVKETNNPKSEYIFATSAIDNDVFVVFQNRYNYYKTGFDIKTNVDLDHIINAGIETITDITAIKEDEVYFIVEDLSELQVIQTLKHSGISYDTNLNNELTNINA